MEIVGVTNGLYPNIAEVFRLVKYYNLPRLHYSPIMG